MPDVIAMDVNLAFGSQQMKRRKLQVADLMYRPAVTTTGIHIKVHGIESLFVCAVVPSCAWFNPVSSAATRSAPYRDTQGWRHARRALRKPPLPPWH